MDIKCYRQIQMRVEQVLQCGERELMVDLNKEQLLIIIKQLKRQQLTNANREVLIKVLEEMVGKTVETPPSRLERSKRFSTSISPESSLERPNIGLFDQLSPILGEIRASLPGFDEAYIFTYTQGRLEMIGSLVSVPETRQSRMNPRPRGLTYSVARLGQAMVIPDMAEHPLYAESHSSGAIVGLPIKSARRVVGVLTVSRKPAGDFTQGEMDLLQGWVDRISLEIETQRAGSSKLEIQQPDVSPSIPADIDLKARLETEIKQAADSNTHLSIVLIDLGKIGDISKAYGRRAGDYLQQAVATAISEALRKTDFFINYASNRWAVILKGADETTAQAIGGRIEKILARRKFNLPGENAQNISIHMGIATFPVSGPDPERLFEAAERALVNTNGSNHPEPAGLT